MLPPVIIRPIRMLTPVILSSKLLRYFRLQSVYCGQGNIHFISVESHSKKGAVARLQGMDCSNNTARFYVLNICLNLHPQDKLQERFHRVTAHQYALCLVQFSDRLVLM